MSNPWASLFRLEDKTVRRYGNAGSLAGEGGPRAPAAGVTTRPGATAGWAPLLIKRYTFFVAKTALNIKITVDRVYLLAGFGYISSKHQTYVQ